MSSAVMEIQAHKIIPLGHWSCFFLKLPANVHFTAIPAPDNENTVYACSTKVEYLLKDTWGPTLCISLSVLLSIIGVVGVFANIVNIIVLRNTPKGRSFHKLLIILACFDLIACLFSILATIMLALIMENVNRSAAFLRTFKALYLLYSLGRTGSAYITVLIAVERYLVVVHYFKVKSWFESRYPKLVLGIWMLLIFVINLPWWLTDGVEVLEKGYKGSGPLSQFSAIFVRSSFGEFYATHKFWNVLHAFFDFGLPLPLLLLTNGLLYRFISQWNRNRNILSEGHLHALNSVRMFAILFASLFICHSFSLAAFLYTWFSVPFFREIGFFIMLAVAANATNNLFLYYYFDGDFREKFWILVGSIGMQQSATEANSDRRLVLKKRRSNPSVSMAVKYTRDDGNVDDEISNEACRLLPK